VGDGSKIIFWHDVWCGDQALKISFSKLVQYYTYKEDDVANHLELSSASHQLNVNFLRATHDWEVDYCTLFFNLLHSFRLSWGGKDKLC
jgi:hypothetical protein